ncbi:MAG: phytanoyl-CoA dioxygenase family protein [Acidobacteriota bacterium]
MPIADWHSVIAADRVLSADATEELRDVGFIVIPGPVSPDRLSQFAEAYDSAVASASPADVRIGSSTTRVTDFVNRGPAFDGVYLYQPILDASLSVIGRPFRLSTMHARTLRSGAKGDGLHVDFQSDADGWPMVGFIFMVDEFRSDNGATRFVPGSHRWSTVPDEVLDSDVAPHRGQLLACGLAGSMIIYNGSAWHGHTANTSDEPRRSLQGAYIRREAPSGTNLAARMRPETLERIGPFAKYLLAL